VLEEANGRIAEMTTEKGSLETSLRRLEEQLAEATDKLHTEEAARGAHGAKEEDLARQLAEKAAALMQMEVLLGEAQQEGAKRSEQPSADQAARLAALQSKLEEMQVRRPPPASRPDCRRWDPTCPMPLRQHRGMQCHRRRF
jgi:chromosome segregation ATPase